MMRTLSVAATVALLGTITNSAIAAEIEVSERAAAGTPTRIFVTGELFSGDEEQFRKKISKVEGGIVIFNSPGGDLDAGLGIGRAVRDRGLITLVPTKYECASACALAWLGGRIRYMSPKGAIGFHAAYYLEGSRTSERGAPNALVGAYLNGLGMSDDAILFMTEAPPDGMNWLTFEIATSYGIEMYRWEPEGEFLPVDDPEDRPGDENSAAPGAVEPDGELLSSEH